MFSDIKSILIEKYSRQLEKLKKEEDRLKELENPSLGKSFSLVLQQKFNIFQRILKTKAYRQYLKTIQLTKEKEEEKKRKELIEKEELLKGKEERKIQIEKILSKYEKVISATTLKDLSIDFNQAVNILNQEQIPIKLEPDDNLDNPERNYQGLEDLVFVHRTDRMVRNNRLTTEAEDSKQKQKIKFNGKEYEYEADSRKDTIQFVVNNEIQSSGWENCKYTVVIPVKDIPKEIIGGVSPGNAYIIGGVALTKDCYVLCSEEDAEELRRQNPKLALKNIITCKGNSTRNYSQILLKLLGYRVEQPNNENDYDSWKDQESEAMAKKIIEENGIEYRGYIEKGVDEENSIRKIKAMLGIYQCIQKNNLVKNQEDAENIFEQMQIFQSYEEKDYNMIGILYKKLEEVGIKVEQSEQQYFSKILKIEEVDDIISFVNNEDEDIPKEMREFITLICQEHKTKGERMKLDNNVVQRIKSDILNKIIINSIAENRREYEDLSKN